MRLKEVNKVLGLLLQNHYYFSLHFKNWIDGLNLYELKGESLRVGLTVDETVK